MMLRIIILFLVIASPAIATNVPTELTTPRGISVWYLQDTTTPSLTLSFAFQGGIEEDAPAKQGAAHIMAALLTEGTQTLSATQFQQEMADNNISFGLSAGREALSGKARFLLHHRAKAVTLLHDALTYPAFRMADFTRIQQTALAALNNNTADPDWRAQRLAMQQVFGGTPYANAARGTPQTLPTLSVNDVKAAHKRHITRARLVVTAVGAASAADVGAMIDAIFADLPQGKPWQPTSLALRERNTVWYSPWQGSAQNTLVFAAPSVPPTADDYAATMVVNDILGGGGFRAALMDELRQNLGATYGAHTSLTPLRAAPLMMGQSAVVADKTDDTIRIIKDVWANAPQYLTPERIAASVTYLGGSLTNSLTSSSAIADYYLGLRLAHLPPHYALQLPEQLRALSHDAILKAATAYYSPNDLSFVVVGPVAPTTTTRTMTELWNTP